MMIVARTRIMPQNDDAPRVGITEGAMSKPSCGLGCKEGTDNPHFAYPGHGVNRSMPMDYTVAAFPTEYRGRTYRSRLEARWAAFFDQLGIAHEYEPFDLGSWSPDFLLPDLNVLVEIKPLTDFDPDIWAKMVGACKSRGLNTSILLTMVAPQLWHSPITVGWAAFGGETAANQAIIGWYSHFYRPKFVANIVCVSTAGVISASGDNGATGDLPEPYSDFTMELWSRATSTVQWQPAEEAVQ